jgi:ferredoxin
MSDPRPNYPTKYKVWIDPDLCTGDALCSEIAPSVFYMSDDGLAYVQMTPKNFPGLSEPYQAEAALGNPESARGMVPFPDKLLDEVVEAADECPGECIYIEVDDS